MAARSMQTKDPGTDESGPGKRDNNSTEPFATSIYFFLLYPSLLLLLRLLTSAMTTVFEHNDRALHAFFF